MVSQLRRYAGLTPITAQNSSTPSCSGTAKTVPSRYRLDGPTTDLRYRSRELRWKTTDTAHDQSRRWQLPQRLHTPTPNVPAGQSSQSPASTVPWTQTSRRIPG